MTLIVERSRRVTSGDHHSNYGTFRDCDEGGRERFSTSIRNLDIFGQRADRGQEQQDDKDGDRQGAVAVTPVSKKSTHSTLRVLPE